jgi:hypothetical protein
VRSGQDGHLQTRGGGLFQSAEADPPGIEALMARNNFKNDGFLGMKAQMRYTESSFDVNEQLAVLGVIRDGADSHGAPVKLIERVSRSHSHNLIFPITRDCVLNADGFYIAGRCVLRKARLERLAG